MPGTSLLTQSDHGTENYGIANAQTVMRQTLDPELLGTLQHRFMGGHKNKKPEIVWSVIRRNWAPGFETLFQMGVDHGLYDPQDPLEKYVHTDLLGRLLTLIGAE